MIAFVAIIAILVFIGWLIYRAGTARKADKTIGEVIRPHIIMYGLSCISGICAFAFFLSMDISKPLKILTCILLGGILIFVASRFQRMAQRGHS